MDKKIEDQLYAQVAREIVANNISPAPMARAMEKAKGDAALAKSLYVGYRVEQLARDLDQKTLQLAEEVLRSEAEARRLNAEARRRQIRVAARKVDWLLVFCWFTLVAGTLVVIIFFALNGKNLH